MTPTTQHPLPVPSLTGPRARMTALMHGVGQLLSNRPELPMPDIQLHVHDAPADAVRALAAEHGVKVYSYGLNGIDTRIEIMPDDGAGSVTLIVYGREDAKFTSA